MKQIESLDILTDQLRDSYGSLKCFLSTKDECFVLEVQAHDAPINKKGCTYKLRPCYEGTVHDLMMFLLVSYDELKKYNKFNRLYWCTYLTLTAFREQYGDFIITDYDLTTWI